METTGLPGDKITWETVSAKMEDGRVLVAGSPLSCSGVYRPQMGERVPVLWKSGRPYLILAHHARRAQFGVTMPETVLGIVEELLVGNFDDTGNDIWYRNSDKLMKLGVRGDLPGAPIEVKWGLDGLGFGVRCGNDTWATFTLDREDANKVSDQAPGNAKIAWSGQPLKDETTILTIQCQHMRTKRYAYWLGLRERNVWWTHHPYWPFGDDDWYWEANADEDQSWDAPEVGGGSATASNAKTITLVDLMEDQVMDWFGNPTVTALLEDWYLDTDGHAKLIISIDWEYFYVGVNQSAAGNLHYLHGSGVNYMEPHDEELSISGGVTKAIGAKKQIDQEVVTEKHALIYDATLKAVLWATHADTVNYGDEVNAFGARMFEHTYVHDAGHTGSKTQEPLPPSDTESYYPGAETGGYPLEVLNEEHLLYADERTTLISNTGTYQLFDPARLPVLAGPYISTSSAPYERNTTLLGGWTAEYHEKWSTETGSQQLAWFYRTPYLKAFQANEEMRLFVVLERYAYYGGTNYVNDIPEIGVFVLKPDGSLVLGIRAFQYGLADAELVSGNAHRIIWRLGAGWIGTKWTWRHTNLETGVETVFTLGQLETFLGGQARLFSPDFFWDRVEPQKFLRPEELPAMTDEDMLDEYATLLAVTGDPEGSVRMVNDEDTLKPLGRYLAA